MSFLKEMIIALPIIAIIAILAAQIVAVPTESMNPVIGAGDIVLVQKKDVLGVFSELNPEDVKVGDIIVYEKPVENQQGKIESESQEKIIHRVIAINESDGEKYLILKGDNNPISDTEKVYLEQVEGKAVMWGENPIKIPELGNIIIYLKNLS